MWYKFQQNDSGGYYRDVIEGAHDLIIEADNPSEADAREESLGVYFNGIANGQDCNCCGNRWASVVAFRHYDTLDDALEHAWNYTAIVHSDDAVTLYKGGYLK